MQTTQDSLSSSKAPPATALDCWLPPDEAAKGFGCTKVPPEGLVSRPVELAMAGGAAASCPVPQEGMGGADTGPPLLGPNGLPAKCVSFLLSVLASILHACILAISQCLWC